jgi:hypothetical protein
MIDIPKLVEPSTYKDVSFQERLPLSKDAHYAEVTSL